MERRRGIKNKFDFIQPQPFMVLSAYLAQENFITINDAGLPKSQLTGIGQERIRLGGLLIDIVNPTNIRFQR